MEEENTIYLVSINKAQHFGYQFTVDSYNLEVVKDFVYVDSNININSSAAKSIGELLLPN